MRGLVREPLIPFDDYQPLPRPKHVFSVSDAHVVDVYQDLVSDELEPIIPDGHFDYRFQWTSIAGLKSLVEERTGVPYYLQKIFAYEFREGDDILSRKRDSGKTLVSTSFIGAQRLPNHLPWYMPGDILPYSSHPPFLAVHKNVWILIVELDARITPLDDYLESYINSLISCQLGQSVHEKREAMHAQERPLLEDFIIFVDLTTLTVDALAAAVVMYLGFSELSVSAIRLRCQGRDLEPGSRTLKSCGVRVDSRIAVLCAQERRDEAASNSAGQETLDIQSAGQPADEDRGSLQSFITAPVSAIRTFFTSRSRLTKDGPRLARRFTPYLDQIIERGLWPLPKDEIDWSLRGQHVEFGVDEDVPLEVGKVIGYSIAIVQEVRCRRIKLARKSITCARKMDIDEALIEVEHLQKLRHPHIVQLVGTYIQGQTFAILLYPATKWNLKEFLKECQSNPPFDCVDVLVPFFCCLSTAVQYIHSQTIRHMDIKPANILVRPLSKEWWQSQPRGQVTIEALKANQRYRVYITDFDVAQNFGDGDQSQTDNDRRMTRLYCSPEAADGRPKGRSSDVFSLGCVFSEIMTVTVSESVEIFQDYRRDSDSRIAYYCTLDKTVQWINYLKHSNIVMPRARLSTPNQLERALDIVLTMVRDNPKDRPHIDDVVGSFRNIFLLSNDCCYKEREIFSAED